MSPKKCKEEIMSPFNCSIAGSNLKFHLVEATGYNLKVPLEELKLINSPSKS